MGNYHQKMIMVNYHYFVVMKNGQFPYMMGYWMKGWLKTTRSSVMCKNKLRMGDKNLRKILMIPCEMFYGTHLSSIRIIYLLRSCRGRFGGLGDTI